MAHDIQRTRLADQVYELLKERILAREMLPGQRLVVPALAEELGLSRSPVREAVQRLVQEGLGTERPHSGAVVAAADLRGLVDLYVVRAELEGLSSELAADSGDADLIRDLEEIQDQHEAAHAAGRRPQMIRHDVDFHARILHAAGNPELMRMLRPVLQRTMLGMLEAENTWQVNAMAEHRLIIAALRDVDGRASRRAMADHVQRVRTDLAAKLERGPGGTTDRLPTEGAS